MSKLSICFLGPNVPLNETLTIHSKDLIYREDLDFVPLGNPLMQLAAITHRSEWDGSDLDWLNLWASAIRRMSIESVKDQDVIISASHGLDQVAYQAMWFAEQVQRQTTAGLVGPDGKPIMNPEAAAMGNRSGAVLQVLVNSAEEEAAETFDFNYAVLPVAITPDTTPEQHALLAQYDDFITNGPAFKEHVTRLPDNEDAAKDVLSVEAEKWRKLLTPVS